MGSQLKRIRRNVEGGSPSQIRRQYWAGYEAAERQRAWAQSVIAAHEAHELEQIRARGERVTVLVLLVLFWAGVVFAVARGCG